MQLILILSLLVAIDADQFCYNLIQECRISFQSRCSYQSIAIKNCCDLKIFAAPTGVYKINKTSFDNANVYCDMTTDNGGWIVIQRNKIGTSVNFNRNWADYESGFGDLNTEFWYGLEAMHCLTQRGQWEMRLDFQFYNKTWSYLHYNQFSVGSAIEEYPLTIGGFTGVGTDYFAGPRPKFSANQMKFSTPDNDNDQHSNNCAALVYNRDGWWYNQCGYVYINKPQLLLYPHKLYFTEMKIRPKNCIVQ